MDCNDRGRARRDRRLDGLGIKIEGLRLDVGENDTRAGMGDRRSGRDIGVGSRDHLVSCSDAKREKRDEQCGLPRPYPDAMRGAAGLREGFLESPQLLTPFELAASEDTLNRPGNFLTDSRVLRAEIMDGDRLP